VDELEKKLKQPLQFQLAVVASQSEEIFARAGAFCKPLNLAEVAKEKTTLHLKECCDTILVLSCNVVRHSGLSKKGQKLSSLIPIFKANP
jgi:hypothetical protein